MRDLSEIRADIDAIDDELITLFKRRMDCAKEVGYYKKERGIPVSTNSAKTRSSPRFSKRAANTARRRGCSMQT